MDISVSIDKIRSSNLKALIIERGYGSITKFSKANGFTASNLTPILNGSRRFTDKLAHKIEVRRKCILAIVIKLLCCIAHR